MSGRIRIGIVGFGYMGKKHLECYQKIKNAHLVAIADVNAHSIKTDGNSDINLYKDIDEMMAAENLDAVDICLPTYYHCETVIKALNEGINVLVEKPFSLKTEEAETMMAVAQNSKKRLMIAHVCRYIPEYQYAKKIIETKELGNPLYYYACRNSPTPMWSSGNWLAEKRYSGGTVMDLQIHDIDIANWLLGSPTEYRMVEVSNPELATTNFGHVVSTIKYENNGIAVLEAGHLMPQIYPFTTSYRLICEKGVVEFSKGATVSFTKYLKDEEIDLSVDYNKKYAEYDPYENELRDFVDCLSSGREFAVSQNEAKLAVTVVNNLITNELFKSTKVL